MCDSSRYFYRFFGSVYPTGFGFVSEAARPQKWFQAIYSIRSQLENFKSVELPPSAVTPKTCVFPTGCGAWIRTKILGFKGRCPTIRRPRKSLKYYWNTGNFSRNASGSPRGLPLDAKIMACQIPAVICQFSAL